MLASLTMVSYASPQQLGSTVMLKRFLTACFLVCMASAAMAGRDEESFAAYSRDDYATALKLSQPLAEKGSWRAQTILEAMYLGGQGVEKKLVLAPVWSSLAAAQNVNGASLFRNFMATFITPAQIAEAPRLAAAWKPRGQ